MAKILITGGTGLVGTKLSELLSADGHEVVHLSRSANEQSTFATFEWDIKKGYIDDRAFEGVAYIIHLAGAGVADERWTTSRKKVIIDSRVDSAALLLKYVKNLKVPLKQFVSASAIGYYGSDTGDKVLTEKSGAGNDFLAEVVVKWEDAADQFKEVCPVAKVRIGVVLSADGGAMTEILKPIKLYAGAPLGNGRQIMSWIHIDDLCEIFKYVIDQQLEGTFNAVAPHPISNKKLTQVLAKAVGKPLILPNVPAFMIKLILGEMSQIVLGGNFVSSQKVEQAGFNFRFTEVEEAVNDLVG